MAPMADAVSRGRPASRTRASWASRTTPHAPPATAAAAVCSPMPPAAHTRVPCGRSASSVWSSTNVVSSPTRPPDSAPRAMTPSAPPTRAARASSVEVTSTRTSRPPPPAASAVVQGEPAARTTVSTSTGRADGTTGHPGPARTPNEAGTHRAASARASTARIRSRPRSSTPSPPARSTAATKAALGVANGETPMTRLRPKGSNTIDPLLWGRSGGRSPDCVGRRVDCSWRQARMRGVSAHRPIGLREKSSNSPRRPDWRPHRAGRCAAIRCPRSGRNPHSNPCPVNRNRRRQAVGWWHRTRELPTAGPVSPYGRPAATRPTRAWRGIRPGGGRTGRGRPGRRPRPGWRRNGPGWCR